MPDRKKSTVAGLTRLALTTLVGLSACSSDRVLNELHQGETTSIELYRQGAAPMDTARDDRLDGLRQYARFGLTQRPRYEHYTRTAGNELTQQFETLPNPTILIYVYPHLATDDRVPIPGYTTAINLYNRDHYALPEELPTHRGVQP